MGQFRWVSADPIPERFDLRRQGWRLAAPDMTHEDGCVTIVHAPDLDASNWLHLLRHTRPDDRRLMLIGGVNTAPERARLLAQGFGDVVSDETSIEELDARARRLGDLACWVPRRRVMATLELDLLKRDGVYQGKALNLHPREFAVLWRLADTPDEPVSKDTLIQDVWRLGFVPESNSIAVHLSRLRRKLADAGLSGLVETGSSGYRLRCSILETVGPAAWLRGVPGRDQAFTSGGRNVAMQIG